MRLKKVRGAIDKIHASPYYLSKEDINLNFFNNNPIEIEIGSGKGNFIIEKAKRNPNINYIGIEKYDSVLVRIIQKLEKETLPNLKLMHLDALEIDEIFKTNVNIIYLNFSDPWPKTRHENRRLTSPVFLTKYEKIFKNKPHIIMKTDNRKLFEYSIKTFVDFKYIIKTISLDLYNDDYPDNIATEYEIKFHEQGNPIYMIEVEK